MVPARTLFIALTVWLAAGLAVSLAASGGRVWVVLGGILAVVAVVDAGWLFRVPRVAVRRQVPDRMALGVEVEVPLTLHNAGARAVQVSLWDTLPDQLETADLPWTGAVPAGGFSTVHLRVQPVLRGMAEYGAVHVEQRSALGLWARRFKVPLPQSTRVYPNYEPVVRFALLSMMNNQAQMGIRQLNRPGQSREFRQLRDYQDGDPISHVDWKTTSRRLTLTTREYEEQRNQTLILMVDCGRRLRAMDGELSQFDHSLNALLLLSFIALRQGDSVGVMSFGSEENRWLPPVKGPAAMVAILNHLYDYQPSQAPGDFAQAVELLMQRWSRRALIVIATNLRSEEEAHFAKPLGLIRKKHLVLVASLREQEADALRHVPIADLASAVRYAAIQQYLDERRKLLEKLHHAGILTIDAPARNLPIELANLYVTIKKRGVL